MRRRKLNEGGVKMNISTGKRAAISIIVAMVGGVGLCTGPSHAETLEDHQPAAGAIVAQTKQLASAQAERSKAERGSRLAQGPKGFLSIISGCSDEVRRSFLGDMVLVGGKFAGTRVKEIRECLGEDGYLALRQTLDPSSPVQKDNKGYRCSGRGTCSASLSNICTSNCMHNVTADKAGEDSTYVSFQEILKDCSEKQRNRFLDTVTWENGRIVHADVESISNCSQKGNELRAAMN
jgi:hypothetical protein